ncbi:MAG: 3'-5' exonuclease domain-containing protein 2 [Muribaculaceae bacterium]|nr:3'-5' exonuclease domain-containing protein 2 [Muribaculaceae bacterium]
MLQTDINISIPKQLLPTLPQARFAGRITVIDSVDQARQALRALRRAGIVGFDTETRPSFRRGHPHKVALMQLSTDDRCFLFRLNKMGLSRALCNFLQDPSVIKVGLSVHDDFNVMRRSVLELRPQGFVELQTYVKSFHIKDISLQKIYAILFGEYMPKSQRLTNWEADELTQHQQSYAAMDAWACLRIYKYLESGSFVPVESPYLQPIGGADNES